MISAGSVSLNSGATLSIIVNVPEEEELNPQASVTVNNTVTVPVAPHVLVIPLKLFDHVKSEQKSIASVPPLLSNHACNSAKLPFPSQTTITSSAALVIGGLFISMIVKVAVVEASLPQPSVAVNITVADPV